MLSAVIGASRCWSSRRRHRSSRERDCGAGPESSGYGDALSFVVPATPWRNADVSRAQRSTGARCAWAAGSSARSTFGQWRQRSAARPTTVRSRTAASGSGTTERQARNSLPAAFPKNPRQTATGSRARRRREESRRRGAPSWWRTRRRRARRACRGKRRSGPAT